MAVPPVAIDDSHRQFIETNAPTPVVSEAHSDINIERVLTLFEGLGLDPNELIPNWERGDDCKPETLKNNLRIVLDAIDTNLQNDPRYAALVQSIQHLIHLLDQPENHDMHQMTLLPIAFACFYNVIRVNAEINQAIMILQMNHSGHEDLPPPPLDAALV